MSARFLLKRVLSLSLTLSLLPAIASTRPALASLSLLQSETIHSTDHSTETEQRLLLSQVKPQETEAIQLYRRGTQHYQQGQFREALAAFQRVLAYVRSVGSRSEEGIVLNDMGLVYNALGDYPQALESFQQALAIHQAVGNRIAEGTTLNNIGLVHTNQSRYAEALEFYQQALVIHREVGNRFVEGTTLNNIGLIYTNQSQYAEALEFYQQALTIQREVGNRFMQGTTLNNIAFTNERMGQYQQALEFYQQALAIHRETGNRSGESYVLSNSGNVYFNLGQYSQALDLYRQASAIAREIGDRALEGQTLNNIGFTYDALGQYAEALDFYQQALAIHQAIGNRRAEGEVLLYTGNTYINLGQYDQALDTFQQSLAIRREIGDRAGEGVALNNIGLVYNDVGQYNRALEFYRQALAIVRELGGRETEGITLNNIGLIYNNLGQYPQALDYYLQSLTILQELGNRPGQRITLGNVGGLLSAQNQPELAIVFYKQAVNITEAIRQDLRNLSSEDQQSYTATVADTYRSLADLLLQQDRVLEAQQVLDLLKVQELEDYLQDVRGNSQTAQGIDYLQPEQQLLELYDQAIAQGQELTQLRAVPMATRTPEQQERLANLVANQQELAMSFDDFLNRPDVIEAVNQLTRTARRQNLDLEQLTALQDNLQNLNQNAVLLYPLILDDRLELVLVTPYSPPIRRTVAVTREELNLAIAQFRSVLTSRTSMDRSAAQQLYQWLIQPIEADLQQANAETLLYAPDGQLRYIPLAALYDGNQWLVQRFRINVITAASLTDFDTVPQGQLRVLAGAFTEGSVDFQVGTRQFSFSGLPFAGLEVSNIAAEIPNTTELLDQAFTPQATIPQMDDYTVVHLATHAEFVPGLPEESFILFGNGDRINLRDMATWSLPNVDLVVLSACKTAVGGELGNGEEILGFGYQIQRTGARAAIASLWSVDDGGTQVLMNAFYAALERGMTKAEALRQAQIALITGDFTGLDIDVPAQLQPSLDRPYYWAPFILIGNGL